MKRILIFGNSGSGKSTLAKHLAETEQLAHLDLDTLAWLPTNPPSRAPLEQSKLAIDEFTDKATEWVIEGCYTDLLELVKHTATEIIFMDLPINKCVENAKNRPWETHKYKTKAEQDANLAMLIDWIQQYETRDDCFSYNAHSLFYKNYTGEKRIFTTNQTL